MEIPSLLRKIADVMEAAKIIGHYKQSVYKEDKLSGFKIVGDDEETRREIVRRLKAIGYLYVTLDLTGYRTGSLNAQIGKTARSA